jgi:hypothetical protein
MKVYHAINQVQRALASEGISKSRKNQQQGYNFRGIDDVYNTVSPLLGQHGLCILPRVLSRECIERQNKSGGALFYVTCEVEFDFVSAEDGSKHVVKTYGEAMDSADKATNKAMSAAYKYALMQAFAIPTEGDNDADAHHHEVAPRAAASPPAPMSEKVIADYCAKFDEAADVDAITAIWNECSDKATKAKDESAYRAFRAAANKRKKALEQHA